MRVTTTSDAVLARLEALEAEIAGLKAKTAGLEAENARLMAVRPSDTRPAAEPSEVTAGPSAPRLQGGRRSAGTGILNRRGLLAGVAALLGAGLAKLGASERIEATHELIVTGTANADSNAIHADFSNRPTKDAGVIRRTDAITSFDRLISVSAAGASTFFASTTTGDVGRFGLLGRIGSASGSSGLTIPVDTQIAGVWGVNDNTLTAAGVLGESKPIGFGVKGLTTNGFGVYGETQTGIGVGGAA